MSLVNTQSVSCVELPYLSMTTSHKHSKHNQAQKRCMNIFGLMVILLFLGQAHCEREKNYRCRKIQIFTSQFADFAKYTFSFPFANCSKPFFFIQCLSQFLKLIVRPPLNHSLFLKASSLEMETFFSTFPRLGC